ncbi:uncharacterized protein LOC113213324 [Frankliniella occidentalis]|uniref:Uncharacterized protein LOC113213324 n=1 Tax=Frankliniella occidentalis TaxID=133901 RepID=A0A9C6WZU1_FRAOC|nr:uncharacterized protein LOC113213324 [Frankliniella occidentalis]
MSADAHQHDELLALLTSWDLERLFETLKANRFTPKDVLALVEEDLPAVTKFKGEQDRLWAKIQEARAKYSPLSASLQPEPKEGSCAALTELVSSETGCTEPGPSSGQARRKSQTVPHNAVAKKMRLFDSSRYAEQLDVVAVLNSSRKGKNILLAYNDKTEDRPYLSEKQRNSIVELLIIDLRDNVDRFQHKYFDEIAKKIQEVFPTEDPKTYYRPPHSEGNDSTAPQGKLFAKLRNMPAQESDSRSSSLSARSGERGAGGGVDSNFGTVCAEPVTDEVLGAKTWLKNSDKPWTVVLQKWRTTAPIRFREFLAVDSDPNSVNIYINEWKILKHKSGYELLLEDFKCLYPDVASNLFIKWELFVRRNIAIGKKDVSKSDVKGNQILQELANEALSPNSQAVLLLALLPSIRANQRVKVNGSQVKVSESECRDSYLLHVKNANDLPLAIRNRREEFSQSVKPGGQPLICAIGPSLADVRSVHVNVANLDWVATSALCAIDICFKSFFALSIPYPKESEHVWSTIQRAVYDIKTPSDKDMNFCHSWIKALK